MAKKYPKLYIPASLNRVTSAWFTDSSKTILNSIYFTTSTPSGSPIKVRIGGSFVSVTSMQVKVGGTFQAVTSKIKVGGVFI